MKLKVSGDSGKEYILDTTNVTCTCPGWIYSKKRFMLGDPERMCKHLRKLFEEKPELFPKVYLDALKAEEAATQEDQPKTFSDTEDGLFMRSEFIPLVSTIKELIEPSNKLVTTSIYRIGKPTINKATLMCGVDPLNYGSPLINQKNKSMMRILGITEDYDKDRNLAKFTFIPSGMKVVEVRIVPLDELVFQRLFDTGPKEEILGLINRSIDRGEKLTSSGFEGRPTSDFSSENSIYSFLGIEYPYERMKYYDI